jgi:hypothetical protein
LGELRNWSGVRWAGEISLRKFKWESVTRSDYYLYEPAEVADFVWEFGLDGARVRRSVHLQI